MTNDAEVTKICKDEGKQSILVWPDGYWVWPDDLEANMYSGRSDDYAIHLVPIEYNEEDIETYVGEL